MQDELNSDMQDEVDGMNKKNEIISGTDFNPLTPTVATWVQL